MEKAGIFIKPLDTLEQFRACHAVQKEAWQFSDLLVVPYTQLLNIQKYSGIVLGAFDGPRLVGVVFGYLGRRKEGQIFLFSQRMGVLPDYQGQGIGERLKMAQRAWALDNGLDCIAWTYDPLEAPNAYLNVGKLGGVARRYERDTYGDHGIPSAQRVPSDRLFLEWELDSKRVRARLSPEAPHPDAGNVLIWTRRALNAITWHDAGWPICGSPDLDCAAPALALEVPSDWRGLRRAEVALAQDWRLKTRAFFEHYLERGYTVVDYASLHTAGRRRNYYLLEKEG